MQLIGEPKAELRSEARDLINLYVSLGERAESFLPKHIIDNLRSFIRLCYLEPDDPAKQQAEINRYILEFNEDIPGYVDVSLMLYPHADSKAFALNAKKLDFQKRLKSFIDTESLEKDEQKFAENILDTHDFSVGTPPVTEDTINFMAKMIAGDKIRDLRKYRDIIGIVGDIEEAHWNYFMDTLDQMVNQSTHYTTKQEKNDFLHRTEWAVNFKGLNGLIRTVVSGNSDTAVELLAGEVFNKESVVVVDKIQSDELYQKMNEDSTRIFVIKVPHMRKNIYSGHKWFPYLTRMVFVDDSPESRSSNTSLVFSFHNGIINTLNKVHTKKLGAPANTQLNLRLILENVNMRYLSKFKGLIEDKINKFNEELTEIQQEQVGETNNDYKNLTLYKLDEFVKQILQDRYALEKLRDYIGFVQNLQEDESRKKQTKELISEFEDRVREYFYSGVEQLRVATILEGGGRNQIKAYGEYLLQKPLSTLNNEIINKCKVIINIIPDNFKRTLQNHFHKNFGVNLFLEKYQEYLTKLDNEADNTGRFYNLLIDLGIYESFINESQKNQKILKEFLARLNNLDKTSIADDVQMIIRDLIFSKEEKPKPYIIYNEKLAWEYKDLFPEDRFDINPFDIEIENTSEGRIDYQRLLTKLQRIKNTLTLFDETGSAWDRFSENLTILINDPANPTGYSDFNTEHLKNLLHFLNSSKITLFLDEAYNDSVKTEGDLEPKWRNISRYVMNNISSLSKISIVASLSTTKNLAATGDRIGALVATPAREDVITYARSKNPVEKGNSNSLYVLCNIIETGQVAKELKDHLDEQLPKDASRYKIKEYLSDFLVEQSRNKIALNQQRQQNNQLKTIAHFEGSPVYNYLLNELESLDKLDVLGVPDDFKYRDQPFFMYWQESVVKELNQYRVNRIFRSESNKRLQNAKDIATRLIANQGIENVEVLESSGSYLFNLQLTEFTSYTDLEHFLKALAEKRGIAALPYKTGVVRFSLGDYIEGSEESYEIFHKEIENALSIFFKYWPEFYKQRKDPQNEDLNTEDIIEKVFNENTEREFLDSVLEDYQITRHISKNLNKSLIINDIRSLYHASPEESGISINTIGNSDNSVIEIQGDIGRCRNVEEFVKSRAFTKVYENLLAQVYKNIPQLKNLDFNTVASKFSKATILKYIANKKKFKPTHFVLDDPDEMNMMREILIEMERMLFSDAKVKILALNDSGDSYVEKSRLEGINRVLKKYIHELLIHFNLPFENELTEPSRKEIIEKTKVHFEEITGLSVEEMNLENWFYNFINDNLVHDERFRELGLSLKAIGYIYDTVNAKILQGNQDFTSKILALYLFKNDNAFAELIIDKLQRLNKRIQGGEGNVEVKTLREDVLIRLIEEDVDDIISYIWRKKDIKISENELHKVTQKVVLFFIELINRTKSTQYYEKYTHVLIKIVETEFKRQNSSFNEMIQHGFTIYKQYNTKNNTLQKYNRGELNWINDVMRKCGVISTEQPVQLHTRIATDAKKREFPFHKVDRTGDKKLLIRNHEKNKQDENVYIRSIYTKPKSKLFIKRIAEFIGNMDMNDYRCKVANHGLFNELFIFQKAYMKYLTDNYRLLASDDISLDELKDFVPDIITIYGAPEKVISFPQVGYFDIPGPNGNIKTVVTPLKKQADYFGNIKKPRLTMLNEKVKEKGGVPIHGSLFAVEEEDGSIFIVAIAGDSGVGKSEMLAAMILKLLKQNLPEVRSIIQIAGDMFHLFRDTEGNIYGIGTEEGDFSRTTDFDPEFIKNYQYLFESTADSNVDDLNSRSTISGLCDISMPYKIDMFLTASNYAKQEAGIIRIDNPENFFLYIDSHGERKEKATSQDAPNFNRSLRRYTGDKNIVDALAKHGNYLDEVLDWATGKDGKQYLASSFKMIDKIDIEEIVNQIFVGKGIEEEGYYYTITEVTFDVIKNRFIAHFQPSDQDKLAKNIYISRALFSTIFDTLASTPAGQPFIAEESQITTRDYLIDILKGEKDGTGKGKKVQCGVLSTDIGQKGKEITGPQKAAMGLVQMIQEVRINTPEINKEKNEIRKKLEEKYPHIFNTKQLSSEIWRYNYQLFQFDKMRKARFTRIDDTKKTVDLSGLKGFYPKKQDQEFSPLLVTPNVNAELDGFGETYMELMSLPNYSHFTEEFGEDTDSLYIAAGYDENTIINNMIIQLLLKGDYIDMDDLSRGRIPEKVNRETIAAAKYAIMKKLGKLKNKSDIIEEHSRNEKNHQESDENNNQSSDSSDKQDNTDDDNTPDNSDE